MAVRNCSRCGKIFVYVGNRLCPKCLQQEEDLFDRVDEYLKKYPGANLELVSEGTGISKEIILDFIRRGRLVTLKAEGLLRCEICGKKIDQGRICGDCAEQLTRGFTQRPSFSADNKNVKENQDRMHIADMLRKRGRNRY